MAYTRSAEQGVHPANPSSALERMWRMHQLLQAEKFPNCRKVAAEFEVSASTVRRDVARMRDKLNLPIKYDAKRFGYYYTESVAALPPMDVSLGDLLAVFVARNAIGNVRGSELEKSLANALAKLSRALPGTFYLDWAAAGADSLSEQNIGLGEIEAFQAVGKAILDRCEITFAYDKPDGSHPELRSLRPWAIAYVGGMWCVFGLDPRKDAAQTLALARMRKVRIAERTFAPPAHFSPDRFSPESLGVLGEAGDILVQVRLDASAAPLARLHRWHPSEERSELGNGELKLSFRLKSLADVERWILSWGEHAEALEPSILRERLGEIGRAYHRFYGS